MEILNFGGFGFEGFEIYSERLAFDLICWFSGILNFGGVRLRVLRFTLE